MRGVAESLGFSVDADLPAKILEQIEQHPESWDQTLWHNSCGTTHCIAGWAIVLSGSQGRSLERMWGTNVTATLLLWREGCLLPSFHADADKAECLERLRIMAQAGRHL